jgi:CRP-like cAMP-binding protein
MVVLPNGILIGHQFVNLNAPYRHFRVRHEITLDYTAPVERALVILQTAMEAADGVLKDPVPVVLVERCADSGVVYSLNYWAPDYPESFEITRRVVANTLRFLDQAGYSPTYPKRDVTILDLAPRHIERGVDMGAIVGRVPLFQRLGAEVLAQIRDAARLREVPPDTVIVTEGDAGASLFIIVAGLLSVTQKGAGREARHIAQLVPGDVFGEMSLLTGSPRSATVTTSTSVTVLEISKADFEPILAAHPEVVVKLSELEAERLAANNAAFALWPDQRNEIATMGVAAFIRAKILNFFGRAEA